MAAQLRLFPKESDCRNREPRLMMTQSRLSAVFVSGEAGLPEQSASGALGERALPAYGPISASR